MLYLHGRLAAEIAEVRRDLRTDLAGVRADVRALTARVDALTERVARIEGAMNPRRPTNGRDGATASSTPPEAAP